VRLFEVVVIIECNEENEIFKVVRELPDRMKIFLRGMD